MKKSKSVYGKEFRPCYETIKLLKKDSKVLLVDGFDSWNVFPFLYHGMDVTLYEPSKTLIYGNLDNLADGETKIYGLYSRLQGNRYSQDDIKVFNENFYESKSKQRYDMVYVVNSLHRDANNQISMDEKIKCLQKSVKPSGYLYLRYHLAIEEDTNKFPLNSYPRYGEVYKHFHRSDWDILYSKENIKLIKDNGHYGNLEVHEHLVGTILAKKKTNVQKSKHIYYHSVNINNLHNVHISISEEKTNY